MQKERWAKLKKILQEAEELPVQDRDLFLKKSSADDETLYQELHALLIRSGEVLTFLDRPIYPSLEEISFSEIALSGQKYGPYEIIRELGRGGMGAVYLAERADGVYRQRVALKVLKRGLDTEVLRQRFRRERQILARLEHPNIARLYDGGTTTEGLPYLVMEYVDGEPISQNCVARGLTARARLKLFQKVCSAVHFAHQNLVIHRDLKPSNILVTSDGEPKLLDFGIAKLLDQTEVGALSETVTHLRMMTPEYASPEQFAGQGVTTASDVYTLGVLLYEILTGLPPYCLKNNSLEEIRQAVCEAEPRKPSQALKDGKNRHGSTNMPDPEPKFLARKSMDREPRALMRALKGDVDNIVLKTMRKEPQRRYASVGQLAEDIDRHLGGFPVLAHKDSLGYLTLKFIRRHRLGTLALSLVLMGIIGFMTLTMFHQQQLTNEKENTQREWLRAQRTLDFMTGLFELASPLENEIQPGDLKVRTLLGMAGSEILRQETYLKEEPLVRAALLETLGNIKLQLQLHSNAKILLEEALVLRWQVLGDNHPDLAQSYTRLGILYSRQNQVKEADKYFQKAMSTFADNGKPDQVGSFNSVLHLAGLDYSTNGNNRFQSGFEIADGENSNQYLLAAEILREYARKTIEHKQYGHSLLLLKRALKIQKEILPAYHLEIGKTMEQLGVAHDQIGNLGVAEWYLTKALEILETCLHHQHPFLITTLNNLGSLYRKMDVLDMAEYFYLRSLDLVRKNYGYDHTAAYTPIDNRRIIYAKQGQYQQAETMQREAITLIEQMSKNYPYLWSSLYQLAEICVSRGFYMEAESIFKQLLGIFEQKHDFKNLSRAQILGSLSYIYMLQGNWADAGALQIQAISLAEPDRDLNPYLTARTKMLMGELKRRQGLFEEASALFECALNIPQEQKFLPGIARAYYYMAELNSDLGMHKEAEEFHRKALDMRKQIYPEDHPIVATSFQSLGALFLTMGELESSEKFLRRALDIRENKLRPDHPDTAETLQLYSTLMQRRGQLVQAAEMETRAEAIIGRNRALSY